MARAEHASDGRVLVGIDISKNRHEVLIAVPGKARRRRMTVLNTADGHRRLIDVLRGFEQPVTMGFEATGNCRRALVFALWSAGFELRPVSSIALVRTREALRNSWDKNDPKMHRSSRACSRSAQCRSFMTRWWPAPATLRSCRRPARWWRAPRPNCGTAS